MNAVVLPGQELAKRFYTDAVRPLLDRHAPWLAHSAALIGPGSEVLGFDSARSADHNWGPRCQIFVGTAAAGQVAAVSAMLAARLPGTFLGWPVRFPDVTAADPAPRHWAEVAGLGGWLTGRLGFDPRRGVGLLDWLATPAQRLAEVTGGAVFWDGLGEAGAAEHAGGLAAARAALTWYPEDVWRYVLACQWTRIGQEEAFPGRCAEAGDDLGSAVVTARLARDVMRLALLMSRRYPPYSKWLGSAFSQLGQPAASLGPPLAAAIAARSWPERERHLCAAYEIAGQMHNDLGLTAPLEPSRRPYFDRPYLVIGAERFAVALRDSIASAPAGKLPPTGTVDQFVDSTDALGQPGLLRAIIAARPGNEVSGS